MKTTKRIKVFVSSPGDVVLERQIVLQIAEELNKTSGRKKDYYIDCYEWEMDLQSGWGKYQENINPELEDTDIFIGILWTRLGTPTEEFDSGTVEEFERIKALKDKGSNIEFAFFRSDKSINPKAINSVQFDRVGKFFEKNDGKIFTTKLYDSDEKFRSFVRAHLEVKIDNILMSDIDNENIVDENSLREKGVVRIYTPELNKQRNDDKEELLIKEDGEVFLLAHSGNAYFNGAPFYKTLIENVRKYKSFKIILLNPYSLEARKIFFAENFGLHNNEITNIRIEGGLDAGKNMARFNRSIDEGLKRLKTLNPNIEVRISNVATDGTILMSKEKLFYEPYLCSRFLNRIIDGLNIFEFQVKNITNLECGDVYSDNEKCRTCPDKIKELCSKSLYKTISEQFYILWELSVPLNEYLEQENKFKATFLRDHDELFKNEIFQLHDSWFAFDPIIGCENNCSYCFLGTKGWRNTSPTLRIKNDQKKNIITIINQEYKNLSNNFLYKTSLKNGLTELGSPPISLGNKTDILKECNYSFLMSFLKIHDKSNTGKPIVLITKENITEKFLNEVKGFNFEVYLFISLSYLPHDFEINLNLFSDRIRELKRIRKYIDSNSISNVKLVHYWRPMTDLREEIEYKKILDDAKEIFECTVGIGLKVYPKLYNYFKTHYPELETYVDSKHNESIRGDVEILPACREEAMKYSVQIGHPFFKHTSCAISFLQNKADYNGSMWRDDICEFCISSQKAICDKFKMDYSKSSQKIINIIEHFTNATIMDNQDHIEVIDTSLTQEELSLYTHMSGKPVYSKNVRFSLVWESSNYKYFRKKYATN